MGDEMNLLLRREHGTAGYTAGRLYIGEHFQCFTMEDQERPGGVKVAGKTAIPCGDYRVVVTFSNRFQKPLPLLLDVPGFEGVRIHTGNTPEDTEGCILVGTILGERRVSKSREAFFPLFERITTAINKDERVTLTIE